MIPNFYRMNTFKNNFLKCLLTLSSLFIANSICHGSPSVIIVGAGVSGIAAAAKLLENNITDLTILEAEKRIGGRIHTVPFGNKLVELGAQWCHGEEDNVVFELANQYDLLGYEKIKRKFYYSTGEPLDQTFMAELEEIFIIAYASALGDDISLGEFVSIKYTEIIEDLFEDDPKKLKLATEALQMYLDIIKAIKSSFSSFDPSAEDDFELSEGHFQLNWKNRGYKTIFDILMKKYPNPEEQLPIDDKIVFNKEVVQINWNDEKQTEVICSDGSKYHADHVIVTVSLGVLKHDHETLFSPKLPKEKINVIQDLGFGAVGKVFLQFPNRWWESTNSSNTFESLNFLWNEEDKKMLLNSSEIDNSWILGFNAVYVEKDKNVLMAWLTGTSMPKIELMPDDVLIDGLMTVLHKYFDKIYNNITHPNAIARHGWYTDPHFRGAYSFQTIKARQHDESPEIILSKPLGGTRVLFAGEATNPIHYSSVHGALETGRREAQRIICLY